MAGPDILLDTNAAISWTRAEARLFGATRDYNELALPFAVVAELLFGVHKSARPKENGRALDVLLSDFPVLYPTFGTLESYGRLCTALRRIGRPIPQNDIWIAALALQHNLPLATCDAHFQHVEGLRVVGW